MNINDLVYKIGLQVLEIDILRKQVEELERQLRELRESENNRTAPRPEGEDAAKVPG